MASVRAAARAVAREANSIGPRRAGLTPVMLLLAAFLSGATAVASDTEQASPTIGRRWSDGVFRWRYNPAGHPTWLDAEEAAALVRRAAEKWEACGVRMEFLGETSLRPGTPDRVNVVGWSSELPGGVRGFTQGRARGEDLIERDVTFNADRTEFQRFPRLLEKVLVHEFGHAIGLRHSPRCDDVMTLAAQCPRMPPSSLPVNPTENDLARCAALYAGKPR